MDRGIEFRSRRAGRRLILQANSLLARKELIVPAASVIGAYVHIVCSSEGHKEVDDLGLAERTVEFNAFDGNPSIRTFR